MPAEAEVTYSEEHVPLTDANGPENTEVSELREPKSCCRRVNCSFKTPSSLTTCCKAFRGVLLLIQLVIHFVDIGSDIALAKELSDKKRRGFAALVIIIDLFPPIVTFILILASKYLPEKLRKGESYRYTVFDVDWLCEKSFYGKGYGGDEEKKVCRMALRSILILLRINRFLSNGRLLLYRFGNQRCLTCNGAQENLSEDNNLEERKRICRTIAEAEYLIDGLFSIIPQMWLSVYFFGEESAVSSVLVFSTFISFVDFFVWIGQSQYWRFVQVKKDVGKDEGKACLKALIIGNTSLVPFYITTTTPAISLYAAVENKYVMFSHVLLYVVLFKEFWWWRRSSLIKEINLSFRLMYLLFKILMKVLVFGMVCVWFVRVMLYVARKDATVPSAVPSFVWPDTRPFLKNMATYGPYPNQPEPLWKRPCNAITRNRTKDLGLKERVVAVFSTKLIHDNICNAEVAPFIFCIVFWMNVLYLIFDIVRCAVLLVYKGKYKKGVEKRNASYYSKLSTKIAALTQGSSTEEWNVCLNKLGEYDGFLYNSQEDVQLFRNKRWTFQHHAALHHADKSIITSLKDKEFVMSLKDSEGKIPYDYLPVEASTEYKELFKPRSTTSTSS